jgi:hypothetical protein
MNQLQAKIAFLQAAHAFAQSTSDADYSTMVLAAQDLQFATPAPVERKVINTEPGTYTSFVVAIPAEPADLYAEAYTAHVARVKAETQAYRGQWAAERMAGI